MTTTNLGRVQGGSFFFADATSDTTVNKTDLAPSTIPSLVSDHVIFPNGDIRKITAVGSTTVTCGAVVANLKGPQGPLPTDAVHYDLDTTESTEDTLLDNYYTKVQTLEQITTAGSSKANLDLSNVSVPSNTPGEITQGSGDRIVETYISSDGNTWYRLWASGWKECGGKVSAPSVGQRVYYPVTFSYVPKVLNATTIDSTTNYPITLYNVESTYFDTAQNVSFKYYACGY